MKNNIYIKINVIPIIIWLSCVGMIISITDSIYIIIPICIGTILGCISAIYNTNNSIKNITLLAFIILIFAGILFSRISNLLLSFTIFFFPILIYFFTKKDGANYIEFFVFILSCILIYFTETPISSVLIYVSVSILSYFLSIYVTYNEDLYIKYFDYYFSSKKEEDELKRVYSNVILEQNDKIENAILNERNRISRDIHDSLGHITSRGILQIGAMIITEKEPQKIDQLLTLKNTLSQGMEEVRKSLHNLQSESIHLKNEIDKIIADYSYLNIDFIYSLNSDYEINFKYSILYIIKEALTNIRKHSNAKNVSISLIEMTNAIYLKIFDDGIDYSGKISIENSISSNYHKTQDTPRYGIGLFSIKKRVHDLNGSIEISNENGFRIFITINKGDHHENTNNR